ncbi:MAG: right-handed parallel beta-helix repeat-containing protein [Planctomycetota bacterium]
MKLTLLLFLFCTTSHATEFFVNKQGLDSNAGTSRGAAFLSIQKGVDALQPGDTLNIGRGEYAEAVARKGLGSAEKETVIRAEMRGTVLLRGDVDAPVFKPVPGSRNTFAADFTGDVQAVYEVDTLKRLGTQATQAEVEFQPGSSFYDAASSKLYVSSTDLRPVDQHRYSIPVAGAHGLMLEQPKRVVLDGLAARGFEKTVMQTWHTEACTWGIVLKEAKECVIRHCTAFLNGGGILTRSEKEGGNLLEDCVAYGNTSPHGFECGGVVAVAARNDTLRNCVAYKCGVGVRIYGGEGYGLIENSLGWGNVLDLGIKGGKTGDISDVRDCVALSHLPAHREVVRSIIGFRNIYLDDVKAGTDTSIRLNSERVKREKEFADPLNFDFRLQATSTMRRSAPDKSDRGPFPYQANVFYVTPGGDDAADGLSVKASWKTLARAVKELRPGDTVYFEQGVYDGDVTIKGGKAGAAPFSLRARGTARVLMPGAIQVDGSQGIEFERLNLASTVSVIASEKVRFNNCRFFAKDKGLHASKCAGLTITHSEFTHFTQAGVLLDGCSGVELSSNVYDNRQGPAVAFRSAAEVTSALRYSDYNSYADASKAWMAGGKEVSLTDARKASQDIYAREFKSVFVMHDGIPEVTDRIALAVGGTLGKSLGIHQDLMTNTLSMTAPTLHSVTATTANIEWQMSRGSESGLAWGETPACEIPGKYKVTNDEDTFRSFSLTGLKPGTTYYFKLTSAKLIYPLDDQGPGEVVNPKYEAISFTTKAADPAPRTLYVSTDGSDSASGLERGSAWHSLAHAASHALPGDTVMVAGGTYIEKVRVRTTGTKERPIKFRSIPGEKVILDGSGRRIETAFVINGKNDIEVDGFYFRDFRMGGQGNCSQRVINVNQSHRITLRRLLWDGRGAGYSGGLLMGADSSDVLVSNCVIIRGSDGLEVTSCPGFRVEHCVFISHMIEAVKLGSPATLSSNIICDSSAFKAKNNIHFMSFGNQDAIVDRNNCYFLRVPETERTLYWVLNFKEDGKVLGHTRMTLPEYKKRVAPTDSVVLDPQFAIFKRLDPAKVPAFSIDQFVDTKVPLDFPDLFATNPEVLKRNMGLQPEAFADMIKK